MSGISALIRNARELVRLFPPGEDVRSQPSAAH